MNPDQLHHAYLIEGDRALALAFLESFLEERVGVARRGNPDFWYSEHEVFAVDDSRMIIERHIAKAVGEGKKIFVLATRAMTHEAQNALLKVFEEPTPHTHFFVIVPSRSILLPTLLSRFHIVKREAHSVEHLKSEAKKFIKLRYKARLEKVKEFAEEATKSEAKDFLTAILTELRSTNRRLDPRSERECVEMLSYLSDRAPSVKLILERVALLVPVK